MLVVQPVEKPWGPNYLRLGLKLSSDFEGEGDFTLLGSFTMTWLNRLGAEWRNDLALGRDPFIRSEFYQPFTTSGRWFVAPNVFAGRQLVDFFDGDQRVAQLLETRTIAGFDLGLNLFTYAQLRAGAFVGHLRAEPNIAFPGLSTVSVGLGGFQFSGIYDRVDSAAFPREGTYIRAAAMLSRPAMGAELAYQKAELGWMTAWNACRAPSSYNG